jgi:hypothetical protein
MAPRICWPETAQRGDVIEVSGFVSCADEPGPCDVRIEEGRLEVGPRLRNCDEGSPTWGCEGAGSTLTRECPILGDLPGPLELSVYGTVVGTILPADGASGPRTCIDFEG